MSTKMLFSDFVDINPTVKIKKGIEYPFVEMSDIVPERRYVYSGKKRIFKSGGAKFQSNDTLFARITPCLENGKIGQFKGFESEVGFGSTEFFVFRAKKNVSNAAYVYYLSSTDIIRKPAEKSMYGASGRQRASIDTIKNIEIDCFPLNIQRKIASILSAYDDLIENNTKRIKILEEMKQTIYNEWFVNFRFPGHENVKMVESVLGMIPEGWEVKKLSEVIELAYGKALTKENRVEGQIPVYGSGGVVGYHNESLVKGPGIIVGRKGNVGSVYWSYDDFYPIDTVYYVNSKLSLYYVYYNLQTQNFINNDAAVPGLSRNQAYLLPFLVPSNEVLIHFEKVESIFFEQKNNLIKVNDNLRTTRDLLLPKLISGEIDVSELDIDVGGITV